MTTTPQIRPAQPEDIATLTLIRRTAILTLATPTMGQTEAQHWADAAAANRIQLALALHAVWVAEIAGAAVGWVEVGGDYIAGMYVQPQHAGQGIGSALLAHAEAAIQAAGYPAVRLDASWNAEEFYVRRGYQPLAERSVETGRPMIKGFGTRDMM
jgi:putative acetyltransferase